MLMLMLMPIPMMEWSGVEWSGVEWSGVEWRCGKQDGR
jgi:hypothetical protein